VLIADVDCSADDGKPVCLDHGVKGYPTMKYFTVATGRDGERYKSNLPRDYDSLAKFVKETLASKCMVDTKENCDEQQAAYIDQQKGKTMNELFAELEDVQFLMRKVTCRMELVAQDTGCSGHAGYRDAAITGGQWTDEGGGQYRLPKLSLKGSTRACLAAADCGYLWMAKMDEEGGWGSRALPACSRISVAGHNLYQKKCPTSCTMELVANNTGCIGSVSFKSGYINGGMWTTSNGGEYHLYRHNLTESKEACLADDDCNTFWIAKWDEVLGWGSRALPSCKRTPANGHNLYEKKCPTAAEGPVDKKWLEKRLRLLHDLTGVQVNEEL